MTDADVAVLIQTEQGESFTGVLTDTAKWIPEPKEWIAFLVDFYEYFDADRKEGDRDRYVVVHLRKEHIRAYVKL